MTGIRSNGRYWAVGLSGLVGVALVATAAPAQGAAAAFNTSRASWTSQNKQGNNDSYNVSLSKDGRFVAFVSSATNMVPGDTNGRQDVFVRDRVNGTTERVSVTSAGAQASSDSVEPAISPDARYVAFESDASDLVSGDLSGIADLFVRDRAAHTTVRITTAYDGGEADGFSIQPFFSGDGKKLVFTSNATDLVPGDTNGHRDMFMYDLSTHVITRVSLGAAGQLDDDVFGPVVSADGRYVGFSTRATNVVAGDTNQVADMFVRDLKTGVTTLVSPGIHGQQGNDDSGLNTTAMSADGRYVAYASAASNLVSGDGNATADVFVRDRTLNTTKRVSVDTAGHGGNGVSGLQFRIGISADGRYVVFNSFATNLVPKDTNNHFDIFVRDQVANTTSRVSVSDSSAQGNDASVDPVITPDGRHIAYYTAATNLVPNDTNARFDVMLWDKRG